MLIREIDLKSGTHSEIKPYREKITSSAFISGNYGRLNNQNKKKAREAVKDRRDNYQLRIWTKCLSLIKHYSSFEKVFDHLLIADVQFRIFPIRVGKSGG